MCVAQVTHTMIGRERRRVDVQDGKFSRDREQDRKQSKAEHKASQSC